tara:strand:- start:22338 stop:22787 length:450 start_codon:yes stop_codon:yes gene_type:complete
MSNEKKTQAALIDAAKTFLTEGDTPTLPLASIAWENRIFDDSGKNIWSSFKYTPNQPIARTIGNGGFDDLTGFIQIDFNIPTNSGDYVLREWEDKGREFFTSGTRFENGGHSVLVTSAGMSQGRVVENYFRKSLTVGFKSQLKRKQTTT